MSLIFFDLETSDKEPCGQILNYCFIRTDDNFNYEDEISGEIRLSVLQIPTAGALLTNRIKILDHQKNCQVAEPQAMLAITNFIANSITVSKTPATLIGYNSARFDLGFIRTSLIRNGINPYFGGKIKYHDVLFLVRKAFITDKNFPVTFNSEGKLSLSLESVSKALNLLDGAQSHHSKDDVLLTIKLCKLLKDKFNIDPANYRSYEPSGTFCNQLVPNYEIQDTAAFESKILKKPLYLLNENYRSALWVDLDKFAEGQGRASISWHNKNGSQFVSEEAECTEKYQELIEKAKSAFYRVNVDNFFSKSSCDIEQDIYRLDMQKISKLHAFIWATDKNGISKEDDADCRELAIRYWLAYGVPEGKRKDNWQTKLSEYAHYRYMDKKFQLVKSIDKEAENPEAFHPTLPQIVEEIKTLGSTRTSAEDQEILQQLNQYILESPIYKSLNY